MDGWWWADVVAALEWFRSLPNKSVDSVPGKGLCALFVWMWRGEVSTALESSQCPQVRTSIPALTESVAGLLCAWICRAKVRAI
jgi:hypothetical protein